MEVVAPIEPRQQTLPSEADLTQLAQQLQEHLLSLPGNVPFQVQCVLKPDKLLILVQHPPADECDSELLFHELHQVLRSAPERERVRSLFDAETRSSDIQITFYLRQLGQNRPYAFQIVHPFTQEEQQLAPPDDGLPSSNKKLEDEVDRECFSLDEPGGNAPDWEKGLELDSVALGYSLLDPEDLEVPAVEAETPEEPERSSWLIWVAVGVGVSVASFAAGAILMSRPCLLGRCEPLQLAENLTQQADQGIQTNPSEQNLQQAEQQLNHSVELVKGIPPISNQHRQAEALLAANQSRLALLTQVRVAAEKAEAASQKSRTPPQSIPVWQEVQSLWRQAIAQLETIPQGTPLFSLAQQRLQTYRGNLATANDYIQAEQRAQKQLAAAKATATIAEARQNSAQNLDAWRQVQVTWQVAINALREIPNTTTSFTEAQQLLTTYTARQSTANREELAIKSFNQAVALARKATGFQQQNQWSQAIANWRVAVTQIQQIPAGTVYSAQAQPLETAYKDSLASAETQLRAIQAQQRLRDDLNRVCAGSPKICSYYVLSNSIRLQFTPAYELALKQAYSNGQAGNFSVLGGAINHINSLQTALQTISNNANLPLEVYNASGTELVGSFNPNR
jgi:hypothetical protein